MVPADTQCLFAELPQMAGLLAYWDERRGGRDVPDRADIDPLTIDRQMIPHLTLYDLFDGGRRARLRLIGSELSPSLGIADPTGHFVEEFLQDPHLHYFTSIMVEVSQHRCPVFSIDRHTTFERGHLYANRLCLPLTRGGSDIAMSLGLTLF